MAQIFNRQERRCFWRLFSGLNFLEKYISKNEEENEASSGVKKVLLKKFLLELLHLASYEPWAETSLVFWTDLV